MWVHKSADVLSGNISRLPSWGFPASLSSTGDHIVGPDHRDHSGHLLDHPANHTQHTLQASWLHHPWHLWQRHRDGHAMVGISWGDWCSHHLSRFYFKVHNKHIKSVQVTGRLIRGASDRPLKFHCTSFYMWGAVQLQAENHKLKSEDMCLLTQQAKWLYRGCTSWWVIGCSWFSCSHHSPAQVSLIRVTKTRQQIHRVMKYNDDKVCSSLLDILLCPKYS